MVRIVHISTQPVFRGGERQIAFIHTGLGENGIDSRIIYNPRCTQLGRQKNAYGAATLPWIIWRCATLSKRKPVIFHAHDSRAFSAASIAGALFRIPVVYTRKLINPVRPTAFNRWKFLRAHAIVGISRGVAAGIRSVFPRCSVTVIPDGFAIGQPLARAQARTALGLPPDAVIAGTVGYFTREKNPQLLIELAAKLLAIRNFSIVCIGSVSNEIRLASPSNIFFAGIVPNAVDYYSAFDCYISTSTAEGLGSALLDALVRGIPGVAMNAGGTADLYPENDPWLIDPLHPEQLVSRIQEITGDLPKARERASIIWNRARELFSVSQLVSAHEKLYDSISGMGKTV